MEVAVLPRRVVELANVLRICAARIRPVVEANRVPALENIAADVVEGIENLTASDEVNVEGIGRCPSAETSDEITLAEVGQTNLLVTFLSREAIRLERARVAVVGGDRFSPSVRVVRARLD